MSAVRWGASRVLWAAGSVGLVALLAQGSTGCAPTLAEAMGKDYTDRPKPTCGTGAGQARPLIVDWESTDRAALEASARRGLAIVRYEGCEMRVLPRCAVKGGAAYDYIGVTPKKDNVVMRDSNEVYANVPISAVKLEGKLAHSGSLNVNMTIVGQLATTKPVARVDELEGDCDGATHVVTSLTVGSFEFFATNAAEQGASVDVLGAGAGTRQTAAKELLNRDGDEAKCSAATGDDTKAPFGCGALLRIEVVPLGQERKAEPSCAPGTAWDGSQCVAVVATTKCKDGEVADKGKGCVAKKQAVVAPPPPRPAPPPQTGMVAPVASDCSDRATCEERCKKDDAKGCLGLGGVLRASLKPGVATADGQMAADAFGKACDKGEGAACTALGEMKFQGLGIAKDAKAAQPVLEKACELGDFAGCNDVGLVLVGSDPAGAMKYFEKACNSSSALGCLGLGQIYKGGRGVPKDEKRGRELIKKACDGNVGAACKLL